VLIYELLSRIPNYMYIFRTSFRKK